MRTSNADPAFVSVCKFQLIVLYIHAVLHKEYVFSIVPRMAYPQTPHPQLACLGTLSAGQMLGPTTSF